MWPFRPKQTFESCGILRGFTDWHSHLLPGVDDGVQTLEETLQILSEYERLGIRAVWLTPHIMEDIPNRTRDLKERFAILQAMYNGSVALHLASENMLDKLFEERLEQDDLLPLGEKKNHLLVETSYFNPPLDLQGLLERVKAKGYHPVLAHPERYRYMDEALYGKLKAMGVKFQLNLFSLAGMYGTEAKKRAAWLLKNGCYDLAGSDLHRFAVWQTAVYTQQIPGKLLKALQSIPSAYLPEFD